MKKRIINPWTWQDKFGFVQANEITNGQRIVFSAGIVSVDEDGTILHAGNMEKQIDQCFGFFCGFSSPSQPIREGRM